MSDLKSVPVLLFGLPFVFLPVSDALADEEYTVAALDPIVVTATLGPKTRGESDSSVTVIDDEDIQRLQPQTFEELLVGQPGLDITSNGSFGKNISVFTRGTGSESTVFLVDGVRLRSATTGSTAWQYFPPQMVERVEIVRGSRSNLYGADAVGGVIQAFTHSAETGNEGWVQAGGGNFNTQEYVAGAAGTEGRMKYSLSASHLETDGTAVVEGGEDKGYRNTSALASVAHQFDSGGEAGVVLMRAQGNTEFEGGDTDFTIQTLGFRLDTPISDYWRSRILLAESLDESDNRDTFGNSTFDTKTRSARWENQISIGRHEYIVGGELLVDEVDSTTEYDESSRTNAAVFGQALLNFGPTDFQLSLRADDNEAFGREETGAVAMGVDLDRNHRARVSYSTSFRAPTFNDLYFPNFGNADLQPETAGSVELGIGGNYTRWFWDAAIYQTDADDLIVFTFKDGRFAPFNVNEARIRGIELSAGLELEEWTVQAAASVTDPRNRETDNRIRRRSAKQFRVDLDRDFGRVSLGTTVKGQGYRYDDADNEERIAGFVTWDLRAKWEIDSHWTTNLTVDNVLDREYSTAQRFDGRAYIAAGRTAMLTIRYDL
ncbi:MULTISPECIES: TonB-dependent receptor [Marinobacter]|jgi:vitamin B12 transporter|uniref:TonB-dependent receptor plug domain-containing protein n=1 Tax=Marinobacter TaxID=2742 RepID=UPI000C9334E5|nr:MULTISPECIES: TonB-dependent receptor [Marinobacter]MAB51855.1 TonB-dependent receptor [Marinobacter sp.]MBJ7278102.1 TonB-dependent receptor [Marinobacter salarius]|tara:strand:+ start:18571 stop:20382 length:1812 start_codon:yes stop_codon:yes gene_type:complete